MPGSEPFFSECAKTQTALRILRFQRHLGWLRRGLVWNSSCCWNPWKSGFREKNRCILVLFYPSFESSITSVLVSDCDTWNLKLVDHQPPNRVFSSELRSEAVWCWTASLRLMPSCQVKEERERCLLFRHYWMLTAAAAPAPAKMFIHICLVSVTQWCLILVRAQRTAHTSKWKKHKQAGWKGRWNSSVTVLHFHRRIS